MMSFPGFQDFESLAIADAELEVRAHCFSRRIHSSSSVKSVSVNPLRESVWMGAKDGSNMGDPFGPTQVVVA